MNAVQVDLADVSLRNCYDRLFEASPRAFLQQSTYWAEVIKDLGPDKPIFLLCRDGSHDVAGLALYLYEHPLGNILTSVPQPGPLGGIFFREGLSASEIEGIYATLLSGAQEQAEENCCLALTIITNPFFDDLKLYERYLAPTFVFENFTQYIALDQPMHRSHGHRNNLNRARKGGYRVEFGETHQQLCDWYQIHCARHGDLGAVALRYELFNNIFRLLTPRHKAHLVLVRIGDGIASGGVYLYHRSVMDVFMLSTASQHLENGANFVNTDYSIRWAQELGVQIYNWQSSPSRRSGVYSYKKQWGSVERPYYFVTKLFCDPAKIQSLGLSTLKAEYPWHYVVPYAAFEQGFDKKYFRKE